MESVLKEYDWILQGVAVVCNKLADAGDVKTLIVIVQRITTALQLSNARLKIRMGEDEGRLN